MIDIHHHCLPNVDDGPREWDEAVAMCRMALDEGIETIVATPHVLRGRWKPVTIPELRMRLDGLRARVGPRPHLVLGSEYFFGHDVVEVLETGKSIIPLAGSRYVLIELAANNVPPLLEQPFYRLQLGGWVPIIAHPERNLVFQRRPEVLASLLELGAKTQITAGSLIGEFGPEAKKAAETFLQRRLVHFVASDAHNLDKRPPRMRAAMAALEERIGTTVAQALTRQNPLAVLENRSLQYDPEPYHERRRGLFTRVRSFFGR
ncbi:MAG: CpsB/CapC family capsule biosynthesis tyrosine phosphatase [Acidobacteriota bacterium]